MNARSCYDELHDKYNAILTKKAGTRYERLAATVFKILEDSDVVIHDVSLIGDSTVAHQIDVHITRAGQMRRVLVECKDFDLSGDKVGLDVVRNFWAVVDDTKADESIILTCNGFTSEAAKFAKAKGIKLCILRKHEESDWDGYIKTVILRIMALYPANPTMNVRVPGEDEGRRFLDTMKRLARPGGISLTDPAYVIKGSQKEHFNVFMSRHMSAAIPFTNTPDKMTITVPSDGWSLEIASIGPIPFDAVDITYDVHKHERESMVTSARVAELIIKGFGTSDVVIWGDQLERKSIDPDTGEVK